MSSKECFKLQYCPTEPEEGSFIISGHDNPRYVNIPAELIHATGELGNKRAKFIEDRVGKILLHRTNVVADVTRNGFNSEEDGLGHDLTLTLRDNCPVRTVHVQVKASRREVVNYKRWIKKKYFPDAEDNIEDLIKGWLTENNLILINGIETKSADEILTDSFYPQLQRVFNRGDIPRSPGQLILFNDIPEAKLLSPAA